MSGAPAIRKVQAGDEAAWRTLWSGYLAFYATDLAPAVTDATWQRLLDDSSPVHGLLALVDDQPAGLVHHVAHASTWELAPVISLEDLFVDPDHRGAGVGRALIDAVVAEARARGYAQIHWMTDRDNRGARRLYRSLATETAWVRYEIDVDGR